MPSKKLFICYTPLQLVITKAVIKHCALCHQEIDIVYIAKIENNVVKNAISEIEKYCNTVILLKVPFSYPIHLPVIYWKITRATSYESVYLASIDNPIVHYILSIINFDKIYTFDDGVANINYISDYYRKKTDSLLEKLIKKIAQFKYDLEIIKRTSLQHYTIYNNLPNIINNTLYIPLFVNGNKKMNHLRSDHTGNLGECNVMLGSVYREIFENEKITSIALAACENFLIETGLPSYYIKHPRSQNDNKFQSMTMISDPVIAEISIKSILQKYSLVNLYGFMSTCQVHLASLEGVNNKIFLMDGIKDEFHKDTINLIEQFKFEVVRVSMKSL